MGRWRETQAESLLVVLLKGLYCSTLPHKTDCMTCFGNFGCVVKYWYLKETLALETAALFCFIPVALHLGHDC